MSFGDGDGHVDGCGLDGQGYTPEAMLGRVTPRRAAVVVCALLLVLLALVWTVRPALEPADVPPPAARPSSIAQAVIVDATPLPTAARPADAAIPDHPRASDAASEEPGSREASRVPEREREPEDATGALTIRVVWADDGTPAAGIGLAIVAWESPDPVVHAVRVRTDPDGVARAPRVPTGRAVVYSDRAGSQRTSIEAGTDTQVELTLPRGHLVTGTVVDLDGNPIAGAEICLDSETGGAVACAALDGTFQVAGIRTFESLRARAPGHAPSETIRVEAEHAAPLVLRFTLQGPGGEIRGRVIGPDGEPVAGATVHVTEATDTGVWQRTDAAGRFEISGLAPGEARVDVRRTPLVPWRGDLLVVPGPGAEVAVRLEAGGTLLGTVRDSHGRPIAQVGVSARPATGGPGVSTWTRSDGTYRLVGLAPGSHLASAHTNKKGEASGRVEVQLDRPVEWNPVLSDGHVIQGRVVDAGGAPLVGWIVQGTERAGVAHVGDFYGFDATDGEGRFRICNCPTRPIRVIVCEPDRWGEPVLVRPGIEADAEPITLTVPDDARPSAFLSGSILGPDGRPVPGVQVMLFDVEAESGRGYAADAETGRFRIGPLRPGRYRVYFQAQDFPFLSRGTHSVAAKAEVELPPARFVAAGRLLLRMARTDGDPVVGVEWGFRKTGAEEEDPGLELIRRRDGLLTRPIAAGSYLVRLTAVGCEELEVPVEVRAGEETPVDATLRPATGD